MVVQKDRKYCRSVLLLHHKNSAVGMLPWITEKHMSESTVGGTLDVKVKKYAFHCMTSPFGVRV